MRLMSLASASIALAAALGAPCSILAQGLDMSDISSGNGNGNGNGNIGNNNGNGNSGNNNGNSNVGDGYGNGFSTDGNENGNISAGYPGTADGVTNLPPSIGQAIDNLFDGLIANPVD